MPAVINTTKDKQYKAARYKALSTIGNAAKNLAVQGDINNAQNAKDFVNNVLSSQINIAKTCENDKLESCGISKKIQTTNGDEIDMPQLSLKTGQHGTESNFGSMYKNYPFDVYKSYGFLTADGYAYNLFYFPACNGNKITTEANFVSTAKYICVNAIYDMNGLKKPNKVGKDIGFVSVYYPNETVQAVAPMPEKNILEGTYNFSKAQKACADRKKKIPTLEEGMSITMNSRLVNSKLPNTYFWLSSKVKAYGALRPRIIDTYTSTLYQHPTTSSNSTLCIEE